MPSDWVKIRTDLYRDPRVCDIADRLLDTDGLLARFVNQNCMSAMAVTRNVMRNAVVGALVSVWGVCRHRGKRHNDDLVVAGSCVGVIDDVADLAGFGSAMADVGWLIEADGKLIFPRFFEEYNAEPEQSFRQKNAERQRRFRERAEKNSNAIGNVTSNVISNDREEKRREEKRQDNNTPPSAFIADAMPHEGAAIPQVDAAIPQDDAAKPLTEAEIARRKAKATPSQLTAIYEAYPRRVGKIDAEKAIAKALLRIAQDGKDDPHAYLLERVMAYRRSPAGAPPGMGCEDFRPHPATWFNQGRYADDESQWHRINGGLKRQAANDDAEKMKQTLAEAHKIFDEEMAKRKAGAR